MNLSPWSHRVIQPQEVDPSSLAIPPLVVQRQVLALWEPGQTRLPWGASPLGRALSLGGGGPSACPALDPRPPGRRVSGWGPVPAARCRASTPPTPPRLTVTVIANTSRKRSGPPHLRRDTERSGSRTGRGSAAPLASLGRRHLDKPGPRRFVTRRARPAPPRRQRALHAEAGRGGAGLNPAGCAAISDRQRVMQAIEGEVGRNHKLSRWSSRMRCDLRPPEGAAEREDGA